MKTLKINNALKVLILTFSLLIVSNRMIGQTPQCNVNIINNNNCSATVTVDWYDSPTNICNTQTFTVVPNNPVNATCTCSNPIVNVRYTISGLGALGGTGFVDINAQNDGGSCTCPPLNTYGLVWAPGTLTIQ